MKIPKPRKDVGYIPIKYQGKTYIMVQDKMGLVRENILLPPALYNFLAHMDMSDCLEDLQVKLVQENQGILVPKDEILKIIDHLDSLYLLESDRFFKKRDKIIEEFLKQNIRPYLFADRSYPKDSSHLSKFIDSILSYGEDREYKEIKAIFAPHIEISVGKKAYGKAYHILKHKKYSQVIVLGVGHSLSDGIFCVTEKDFDTPFGVVTNHKEATKKLKNCSNDVLSRTDFEHKFEHSIEFQLIFLKYLLKDFKIIPILCGSLLYLLPKYSRSEFSSRAREFLETLREIIMDPKENTLVVAGVDMCHIGPKFGHEEDVHSLMSSAKIHDLNLLTALIKRDGDGFWKESISVKDRYNVCGFSALATLLEVVDYTGGEILEYEINIESPTRSGVGFAGGVLF